jgi:lycopene beta-cyclase
MQHDVELLILGGGCAGLSLAMKLAQRGHCAPSTLILEQRACYENDRTWCFWGDDETPFAQQATHQWQTFKVARAGQERRIDCSETPYRMLTAEQFYIAALAALSTVPQMTLKMASTVNTAPQFREGRWHVETPDGAFSAARVVDTRPQRPPVEDGALMWQSFYGLEIECALAVFEPSCVELMNFSVANSDRIAFTYVLPLSSTRALVEFTVFAVAPFTSDLLSLDLQSAIAQRVEGSSFTVLRSEHGILPMGLTSMQAAGPSADPSYARVGLFAGAARPATGYAFQRIQRWATDCDRAISNGDSPIGHPKEPALRGWMDTVFLNVIRRQPELAPHLFLALFSGGASQRVIRFLGESGRLSDYLAITCALPLRPFLRQLFRLPRSR